MRLTRQTAMAFCLRQGREKADPRLIKNARGRCANAPPARVSQERPNPRGRLRDVDVLDFLRKIRHQVLHVGFRVHLLFDFAAGMHDGGMVAVAEELADFGVA